MQLNKYSESLIHLFEKAKEVPLETANVVNPLVSELASWYEKFRNSIEYRDEEVILRASIERILKRRLALGGSGSTTAKPLLKELVWARYFPESMYTEETIGGIEKIIDFYLNLKNEMVKTHHLKEGEMRDLMFQLMSSDVEQTLHPNRVEEAVGNYIFHVLQKNISATPETEEERDVQLFIAIRRAYSKDDLAFLRFKLFTQYFGKMNDQDPAVVSEKFGEAYKQIESQLKHPARFKILSYVKRHIPPFLIMEDIFASQDNIKEISQNEEELNKLVLAACQRKYKTISEKVRRAIIRSVIFILLSKTLIAFGVEGTYERIFLGHVQWMTLSLNVIIPTLFMIAVGFSIRTPGDKNSRLILGHIHTLLFENEPKIGRPMHFPVPDKKPRSAMEWVFGTLWIVAFMLSFGAITLGLSFLGFSAVSQMIFIFFLAIVSFLAYRINITAHEYSVESRQGILTPIVDFFFMPIARVGQYITAGVSQINIFLFILDFLIEAPYKGLVGFFDQWFFFLHSKREEIG
ncbi:MAG: hypothetical protein Q7T54_02270 [Candidatus Levybacteria bacterium]|nr:hypothetical protein [Candidatus Levybacteria bacterium]